jgi:cytochrome bd ubiquinol oxidase subunit II
VPLNDNGYFSLPLFNILNWYALLIGVFGLVVLAGHGATFLATRIDGELGERARRFARALWWPRALLFVALVGPTYAVRHEMLTGFADRPWTLVFPVLAVAALLGQFSYQRRGLWLRAFVASGLFIVGLLTAMASQLYPNVLPAHVGNPNSLTVDNAAAGHDALTTALVWWPIGMVLAAVYFLYAYRMFFRRPTSSEGGAPTR